MHPKPRQQKHRRLVLQTVGSVRVERDGIDVPLRPAQRRLLAILALSPGRELDTERLIDRMWGDGPPRTARTAIQTHISSLRKVVPGIVASTARGYRIAELSDDRAELEGLAVRVQAAHAAGQWVEVIDLTGDVLRGWNAGASAELVDDVWAGPELRRTDAARERIVDSRLRALLALERHDEVIELARAGIAQDPLNEAQWVQLVVALDRTGRTVEALRACREADRLIRSELGVASGPALQQLENQILFGTSTEGSFEDRRAHNLIVPAGRFIGRGADLAAIESALVDGRSVAIVGAPGIGKTRLAIEVGRLLLDRFPEGVAFVPLAGTRTERDVLSAIASAIRTRVQIASLRALAAHVARRRMLVILDNCEHVLDECSAFVEAVLSEGEDAHVIVTSRRPMRVAGQTTWQLAPLALPAATSRPARHDEILRSEAVQLFTERARAADPSFKLAPETIPIAEAVCRGAAGLPLAIELAAAWLPAIGVTDLREILVPGMTSRGSNDVDQDASLRSAIDRSIDMLPPADDRLLHRLAVFAGSFTLRDARAICDPEAPIHTVAARVARLVDASLLVVEHRPVGRATYRTLEPIRDHLQRRRPDGRAQLRAAFVDHFLDKARAWCPDPMAMGADLASIDTDIDNMREAFDFGLTDGKAEAAGWAILALRGYFYERYLEWEAMRWSERALNQVLDVELRGWLLRSLGSSAHNTNDVTGARRLLARSLRVFRQLRHRDGMAMCLLSIAQVHATQETWGACRRDAERARRLLGPAGNLSGRAVAAYYVGESLAYGGSIRAAQRPLERAARLFEESNQPHRAAYALSTLATVLVLGGYEPAARRHAARAVALARRSGSGYRLSRALGAAAACEAVWGDAVAARGMLAEAYRHVGPLTTDLVSEFLLPAGFLVERHEAWEWLAEMLVHVERVAARRSMAIGEPWRNQIDRWHRALAERGVEADSRSLGGEVPRADELAARTLEAVGAVIAP